MKKMIGFYCENYVAGGVESVLLNTINSKAFDDLPIMLIYNRSNNYLHQIGNSLKQKIIPKPITLICSKTLSRTLPINNKIQKITEVLLRDFLCILSVPYFIYLLKKNKINKLIIHNGGYPGAHSSIACGMAFYFLTGRKPVHVIHNFPTRIKFYSIVFDYIYDFLVERYFTNITVSKSASEKLLQVRNINSQTIYNGVEIKVDDKKDLRTDQLNLVSVARLDPEKGHKVLLKAIKDLKEIHNIKFNLKIYGKGSFNYTEDLKHLCNCYGIKEQVSFKGFQKNKDIIYQSGDILVFPSLSDESFPMAILESLAYSTPVIATDVGGIREIFSIYNERLLIKPNNSNELVEVLLYFINLTNEQRNNLCIKGKELIIKYFSKARMGEKYLASLSDNY